MEKNGPRAICYESAPSEVVGWICGSEACVYLRSVYGDAAESMAAQCAHSEGTSRETTTLEAPPGTIGAIGGAFTEDAADSGDEA